MCEALGSGADKLWTNAEDFDRNSLHQAIISVCFITTLTNRKNCILDIYYFSKLLS